MPNPLWIMAGIIVGFLFGICQIAGIWVDPEPDWRVNVAVCAVGVAGLAVGAFFIWLGVKDTDR